MNALARLRPQSAEPVSVDQSAASAAKRFAELDFSVENEKLAAIDQEIARIDTAIDDARERAAELLELAKEPGHKARRAVADALMSGTDPAIASVPVQPAASFDEQRAALMDGIRELIERRQHHETRAADIKTGAAREVQAFAQPVLVSIMAEAQDAAQRFADAFASMKAVSTLTGAGKSELRQLDDVALALEESRVLLPGSTYHASEAVADLHTALADKGDAFRVRFAREAIATTGGPERIIQR